MGHERVDTILNFNWLVFFYSLPTKPEKNRMRIWRRFQKEGVLPLNGSYILPYDDERFELCQWLVKEIESLNGNMNFFITERLEPLSNDELIEKFIFQAELSYQELENKIKQLQQLSESVDKNELEILSFFKKVKKEFTELWDIDFFKSLKGKALHKELSAIENDLERHLRPGQADAIKLQNKDDFQGKQWLTRPKPFVDRMASAWFIRKFIDPDAQFVFATHPSNIPDTISYDMNDADFTHIGNLCTFEVMMLSFGIEDQAIIEIAKVIHNLDLKDNRYITADTNGIEKILSGIRNGNTSDLEIIKHSFVVFDALYQAYQ